MRVSDRLVFDSSKMAAGNAREAAQRAQDVAATGLRLQHPSDDPTGSGLLVAYDMSSSRFAAIARGAEAASDELHTADVSLGVIADQLTRARELTVKFSSAGYPQEQMAMGAREIECIRDQVISSLNVRFGNRFVFGGTTDDTPPFDTQGVYHGDSQGREVEVAPGVYQRADVDVTTTMTGSKSGVAVIQSLDRLAQALSLGDMPTVREMLEPLDKCIDQVATARAQAGVAMNAFDAAANAAKLTSTNYREASGEVSDADLIDAAIKLHATQTALQASLAAISQGFRLSLVDYLK